MTSFSFVGLRRVWFTLSAVMILGSIAALALFGLRFGVDFTGGSLMEVHYAGERPENPSVISTLEGVGIDGATVQPAGEDNMIIRLRSLSEDEHQQVLGALRKDYGEVTEQRFNSVGPVVGSELRRSAIIGVAVTLLLIGLYISWVFRKVSDPIASWKYGLIIVITAAHDVIVPLGAFAVFGRYDGWEVGAAFVAAVLTILGYSISDTVVVFDRVRENLLRDGKKSFAETVDESIKQTFVRSVNTSVTTLLALIAIAVFGGPTTRPFAVALIIGIVVGTYSSIFFAAPALVEWEQWRQKRK